MFAVIKLKRGNRIEKIREREQNESSNRFKLLYRSMFGVLGASSIGSSKKKIKGKEKKVDEKEGKEKVLFDSLNYKQEVDRK